MTRLVKMSKHKLSASAINTFLQSPKKYYWHYIARLQPIQQSTMNYDHDKLCGILWAEFIDRFYKGISDEVNIPQTREKWLEATEGWVPDAARDRLTKALEAWMMLYGQHFSPNDGCRTPEKSELWVENFRFCGKLDGLSEDGILHEVKSTSRGKQLAEQQWKVEHSLQVRLYCVLADAKGYRIEFAYKDPPYQLFRGPIIQVTQEQKHGWEQELNALADSIYFLEDNPENYPCHPDGCCLVTKNMCSMCQYQLLCDSGLTKETKLFYKEKEKHR